MGLFDKLAKGVADAAEAVQKSGVIDKAAAAVQDAAKKVEESGVIDKAKAGVMDAAKKVEESGVIDKAKAGVKDAAKKVEESGIIDKAKAGVMDAAKKVEESGVIDKAKESFKDAAGKINNAVNNAKPQAEPAPEAEAASAPVNTSGANDLNRGSVAYFEELIKANFYNVEIRKGVKMDEFTTEVPEKIANIDILLTKDGKPALAILLIGKDQYRLQKYLNTMSICEKNGFKAIRFMKEFENAPSYVVDRIRGELN